MKRAIRVKRRLLRASRGFSWGTVRVTDAVELAHVTDDGVPCWRLRRNPWYVHRKGLYVPYRWEPNHIQELIGAKRPNPKSRQRWLKDVGWAGRDEVNHALSDCCGYGHAEGYGTGSEAYPFVTGSVPPEPHDDWRKVAYQKRHRRR